MKVLGWVLNAFGMLGLLNVAFLYINNSAISVPVAIPLLLITFLFVCGFLAIYSSSKQSKNQNNLTDNDTKFDSNQSKGRRKCPFCAELVASEAKICKHCQRELPAIAPSEDGPKIIEIQSIEQATGIRLKINDLQDGEAQAAGIRRGDIILSYGGIQIQSIEDLSSALLKFAGKQVQLIILRGTEIHGFLFTVRPLEAASTSFLGIIKSGLLAVELEDSSNQQAVRSQTIPSESPAQVAQDAYVEARGSARSKYIMAGIFLVCIAIFGYIFIEKKAKEQAAQASAEAAQQAKRETAAQQAALALAEAARFKANGPAMVRIPGKNYELGKYEVTQGQWKAVMGSNPSGFSNCGDSCPVEMVSWNDAQEFIGKLNAKTGKQYRLPTEAEWEYACYGGSQTKYCGGNNPDAVGWYGNYRQPGGNSGKITHPAGQKQANGYGLYDMSGNVSEWTSDCGEKGCAKRDPRGGSWDDNSQYVHAANHEGNEPESMSNDIGFRLARTLP